MIGLGTVFEGRVFDFDKVADTGVGPQNRTGPQTGIGANSAVPANGCPLKVTEGADPCSACDPYPVAKTTFCSTTTSDSRTVSCEK